MAEAFAQSVGRQQEVDAAFDSRGDLSDRRTLRGINLAGSAQLFVIDADLLCLEVGLASVARFERPVKLRGHGVPAALVALDAGRAVDDFARLEFRRAFAGEDPVLHLAASLDLAARVGRPGGFRDRQSDSHGRDPGRHSTGRISRGLRRIAARAQTHGI